MNNYEYIIAGLPVLQSDSRDNIDVEAIMDDIRSQLDAKDTAVLELLLSGFDGDNLNADFYRNAGKAHSRFIREYFAYDLKLRNAKVEYLNRTLGRAEGTDVLLLDEDATTAFEGREEVDAVLAKDDILARERGLDDLIWEKIDEITVLDVFNLDVILAFVAKLQIIVRWLRLDEATGRELFRKLVKEIKENYNKI